MQTKLAAIFRTTRLKIVWLIFAFALLAAVIVSVMWDEYTALVLVLALFPVALLLLQKLESFSHQGVKIGRAVERKVSDNGTAVNRKIGALERKIDQVGPAVATTLSDSVAALTTADSAQLPGGSVAQTETTAAGLVEEKPDSSSRSPMSIDAATSVANFIADMDSASRGTHGLTLSQEVSIGRVLEFVKPERCVAVTDLAMFLPPEWNAEEVVIENLDAVIDRRPTLLFLDSESFTDISRSPILSQIGNNCALVVIHGETPDLAEVPSGYQPVSPGGLLFGVTALYPDRWVKS